jgi:hypothetical protein
MKRLLEKDIDICDDTEMDGLSTFALVNSIAHPTLELARRKIFIGHVNIVQIAGISLARLSDIKIKSMLKVGCEQKDVPYPKRSEVTNCNCNCNVSATTYRNPETSPRSNSQEYQTREVW